MHWDSILVVYREKRHPERPKKTGFEVMFKVSDFEGSLTDLCAKLPRSHGTYTSEVGKRVLQTLDFSVSTPTRGIGFVRGIKSLFWLRSAVT